MNSFFLTHNGLSSGRAGVTALRDAFAEFLDAMVEVGGPAYGFENMLNPGLPEAEIRARFADHGIDPPDELVTYWTLHDGLNGDAPARPPASWLPGSLEATLSWWAAKLDRWEAGADRDSELAYEDPRWFDLTPDLPIVADISGAPDAACRVRRIDPEMTEFGEQGSEHQLASICTMFDMLAESIRRGMYVPYTAELGPARNTWHLACTPREWFDFTKGTHVL